MNKIDWTGMVMAGHTTDRETIESLYNEPGGTVSSVAHKIGVAYSTMQARVKALGIKPKCQAHKLLALKKLRGMSVKAMAKEAGCTNSLVNHYRRNGRL